MNNKRLNKATPVTSGLLLVAVMVLGYRSFILSQEVTALKKWSVPRDIKQVMARKLLYADKTWHAAGWYAAQVWRMGNSIAKAGIENANGPLAELEQTMFLPTIGPLIDAMRADDAATFEARYRDLVAACNACHAATEHAYVRIAVPGQGAGQWNQTFTPSKIDW